MGVTFAGASLFDGSWWPDRWAEGPETAPDDAASVGDAPIPEPDHYPPEPGSITRATQSAWLDRPATPLVLSDVFKRRRNFVTSDLHVLLVTMDQAERERLKAELNGLHYTTSFASSGKVAQAILAERGGEIHVVMVSAALGGGTDGPDCAGFLAWVREHPALRELALIALGSKSIDPVMAMNLLKAGAHDILTRPIPVEALMRFRHIVGNAQSLTQQRAQRKEEGGARLVTSYLLKKEREHGTEAMGLQPSALDRRDAEGSNVLLGEVTINVLLLQRETRKVRPR